MKIVNKHFVNKLAFPIYFSIFLPKGRRDPCSRKILRADFREGDLAATFQFSESGGSLNGPDLFTDLPFL